MPYLNEAMKASICADVEAGTATLAAGVKRRDGTWIAEPRDFEQADADDLADRYTEAFMLFSSFGADERTEVETAVRAEVAEQIAACQGG